jgi:hypothetical protein
MPGHTKSERAKNKKVASPTGRPSKRRSEIVELDKGQLDKATKGGSRPRKIKNKQRKTPVRGSIPRIDMAVKRAVGKTGSQRKR